MPMMCIMRFEDELRFVLPEDLPRRDEAIVSAAKHLEMIAEANEYMNLTRITTPREAAIKHVLDSVLPWRLFAGVGHVLDAGTGPGYPGVPLAIVLPETRFTLVESTQKKARFVESVIETLGLTNVTVSGLRAEDVLKTQRADVVTARAVAPIGRALVLFGQALKAGSRCLLYKGPDAETEIAEAAAGARKRGVRMRVVERYDLPDALGTRTIVELTALKV
jgi:16S rRNA (guanine527-N7)-methyltransferase